MTRNIWISIVVVVVLIAGGWWYLNQLSPSGAPVVSEMTQLPEQNIETNANSANQQMTDSQSEKQTTLTKIKDDGRFISYNGSIVVSGKYNVRKSGPDYPEVVLGGKLCFYPDNATGYLIPRDPNLWGPGSGDARMPWFCFKDQYKAKEMFGINYDEIFSDKTIECIQGKATIEVSDYVVDKLESAVFDTANLNKIISKENYSTQCK